MQNDEYSVIEPIEVEIQFRNKHYEIRPLTVGQIPKFARAIKPLAGLDLIDTLSAANVEKIVELLADHGDSLIEAIAVATGIPRQEIDAATADELIELGSCVVKVNGDFFARRLAPSLSKTLVAVTSGRGRTPSTT